MNVNQNWDQLPTWYQACLLLIKSYIKYLEVSQESSLQCLEEALLTFPSDECNEAVEMLLLNTDMHDMLLYRVFKDATSFSEKSLFDTLLNIDMCAAKYGKRLIEIPLVKTIKKFESAIKKFKQDKSQNA